MADAAHPRLTASEGRRFAWTVAVGFGVVGTLAFLRGRTSVALWFGGVALMFLLSGLVVPTRLEPVRRGWMALGVALSRVTSPVFYAILYWGVLTPIGLLRRTLGRSPLVRDGNAPSYWVARTLVPEDEARRRMDRQF